jgi:hypothetical protein
VRIASTLVLISAAATLSCARTREAAAGPSEPISTPPPRDEVDGDWNVAFELATKAWGARSPNATRIAVVFDREVEGALWLTATSARLSLDAEPPAPEMKLWESKVAVREVAAGAHAIEISLALFPDCPPYGYCNALTLKRTVPVFALRRALVVVRVEAVLSGESPISKTVEERLDLQTDMRWWRAVDDDESSADLVAAVEDDLSYATVLWERAEGYGDVVASECHRDKRFQISGALDTAREHAKKLDAARAANDVEMSVHELSLLRILVDRADQLAFESRKCIS